MNDNNPKPYFSVIVPFYNESLYIKDTVISVLNQQFSDFEVIFINDGSTDDTEKIILNVSGNDSRIRIIKQAHLGKCIARNTGIINAKGDWICFLNCGDTYFQNHLRIFKALIESHEGTSVFCTSEFSGVNLKGFMDKKFWGTTSALTFENVIKYDQFSLSQFCIHKKVALQHQFPSMNMIFSEELLFLRQVFFENKVIQKHTVSAASRLKPRFEKDTISFTDKINWIRLASEIFINNYRPSKSIRNKIRFSTRLKQFDLFISYGEFFKALRALFSTCFVILQSV